MGGHKVLVTGATGLVGGNLARLLVEEKGEPVKVLVRSSSNTKGIDGLPVERATGDVTDRASLERAMEGCDRVYHAAAMVTMWNGALGAMRRINVGGTENVLAAAKARGIARVVHVSTVDTIGMRSRENPSDEEVPYDYAQYRNAYSLTKHEAWEKVRAAVADGLPVMVGCPTYMFGAYDVRPTSGTMILEVKAGKTVLAPGGGNNFVDVLDVCRGLIALCEKGRAGDRYILANANGNLTYREIFARIADIIGARRPVGNLPKPLAMLGGYAVDLVCKLTGKSSELNSAAARMGFQPHYFTPARAVRDLGMPQSPVDGAIRRAWEWFGANGYVK